MGQKKLYKSVLKVEIISEDPLPDCLSLRTIDYETTNGEWSGAQEWESHNAEIVGKEAVTSVENQGSCPSFFQMDEDGNEIED